MALPAQVINMEDRRKAGPQLEDGHIRIANELFDAILKFPFTLKQQSVVLAVLRKTYGFSKKVDDVSAAQLGALCGMARNHVTETLNQLCRMGVISKRCGEYGSVVGINKRYSEWAPAERPASPSVHKVVPDRDSPKSGLEVVPDRDKSSPETGLLLVPNQDTQQTTSTTNQQTTSTVHVQPAGRTRKKPTANDRFDRFWSAYPNPKSKAAAMKAFTKIDPDEDLLQVMIERVDLMKRTDDWLKDAGKYIPMGASWLNGRGWEDGAPITAYTDDELQVLAAYNRETDGTDWPEALTEPYSRERAGLVRAFMVFSKGGAKGAAAYFRYVAENVPAADTTGFDWLMRRETYLKIREGVHRSRGDA